jgi:hypothetical protein
MTRKRKLPDPHSPNALSINDGQQTVGSIVKEGDEFFLFDAAGKFVGIYDTLLEAARKIGSQP